MTHTLAMHRPKNTSFVLLLGLLAISVIIAGVSLFLYTREKKINAEVAPTTAYLATLKPEERTAVTMNNLKKILIIQTDEQPAVAVISDAEKVKESNPEFYKLAQNNDSLVVYKDRAILFRDTENKIVGIAPIISSK